MRHFFEALKACNHEKDTIVSTVIAGKHLGEKAIFASGKLVYRSQEKGFFENVQDRILPIAPGISSLENETVYTEYIGHTKKLVICGCGHVAMPIITIGKMLDFHVIAIDDRNEFVSRAKKQGADEAICNDFGKALDAIESDEFTYFVIVTRGHSYDSDCLRIICHKPHAYIGMMGSKRRVAMVKQDMIQEGIDSKIIENVHSPIGLKIHSDTPAEIAVSIMAEIISVKNQKKEIVYPDDVLACIEEKGSEKKILATIISREGSAPRQVGSKMLICSDETCVNTIGGGLVEAKVITRAKQLLQQEKSNVEVMHMDLTADEASKEGEVCGGSLSVLLEEVYD